MEGPSQRLQHRPRDRAAAPRALVPRGQVVLLAHDGASVQLEVLAADLGRAAGAAEAARVVGLPRLLRAHRVAHDGLGAARALVKEFLEREKFILNT